ncbi:MAG: hypothetical protein JJ863_09940 [Deltaproteobacteria bacterium]|nr:hypothetical protein [Deltaproteobacteria bacterium]
MTDGEGDGGSFEFNWRGLAVTVASVGVLVGAVYTWPLFEEWRNQGALSGHGDPIHAPDSETARRAREQLALEEMAQRAAESEGSGLPDSLDVGSLTSQRDALDASHAFELEGAVRAFAIADDAPNDWFVGFYRRGEEGFERFGPIFAPTGYDPPALAGEPPQLTMRLRALDVPFVFRVSDDDVSFDAVGVEADCISGCADGDPASRIELRRPEP